MAFRHILRSMRAKGYNTRTAAIVGLNESALRMRDQINSKPDLGIRFEGFFDDRASQRLHEEHPDEVLMGAISGSIVWFSSLALGAAKLSVVLAKPKVKRVIDTLIGLVMWFIAWSLLMSWLAR